MAEPSGSDDEILAVFRDSRFRWYLASRFFAGTAMMLLRTAVSWHVYDLSQSAFQLGMIGLIQFLPVLPLSLVAGAVGSMNLTRCPDGTAYERASYIQILQGWHA